MNPTPAAVPVPDATTSARRSNKRTTTTTTTMLEQKHYEITARNARRFCVALARNLLGGEK